MTRSERRPHVSSQRILLIEDSVGDAELAITSLNESSSAPAIRHVQSLREARAALAHEVVDAILLDLDLPDSEGLATLQSIKALVGNAPVIVLAASADDRLRAELIASGAEEVVDRAELESRLFARSVLYVVERDRARARHQSVEVLLDTTPDAILVVTRAGIVRYVNQAALALFRRSREELVGELLGFSIRDGEPLEIAIPRRDGERICEMRVVPFEWHGEPALLAAIRDLTELKRSQQDALDKQRLAEDRARMLRRVLDEIAGLATRCGLDAVARGTSSLASVRPTTVTSPDAVALVLRAFEEAFRGYVEANQRLDLQNRELADAKAATELSNRELEAFTSRVAHDLRAPLRRIEGFTRLLQEDRSSGLDRNGQRQLARIVDGTRQMTEVIESLLALSRVTRAELRRGPVDLSRLAHTVLDRLVEGAPARAVELHIPEGMVVDADRSLAQIALENLLGNAFKFTARREVARIELGTAVRHGACVYYVRDNGAGFDPVHAERMFDVFARLHPSSEFDGTGIGLSIVKRVVERHGGHVWAEGVVGQGATFYFSLEP